MPVKPPCDVPQARRLLTPYELPVFGMGQLWSPGYEPPNHFQGGIVTAIPADHPGIRLLDQGE